MPINAAMSRRGFTLAELLVVMGMTSVVLTVGVGMLHRVMQEQKLADRENVMHRVAERLSTKLREDVHVATHAKLIPSDDQSEQRLELNQPGQRLVTYAVRGNVLERAATRENGLTHRDGFPFPDNYRLRFSEAPTERVTFTAFAVPQAYLTTVSEKPRETESEKDVGRAVMHVEASVARDHRFLKTTKKPSES